MKITDKQLMDIIELSGLEIEDICIKTLKKDLKEKGYDVEKDKSKLELAKEIECKAHSVTYCEDSSLGYAYEARIVDKKLKLLEEAIKELQKQIQKMRRCYNCKHRFNNKMAHCEDFGNRSKWEMDEN